MKHRTPILLGLFMLVFAGAIAAFDGDSPESWHRKIPYAGTLQVDGQNVSTPTDITFSLYPSAAPENPAWVETQTVSLNAGAFSVVLGDNGGNPIPAALFESRAGVFIGMQVDGIQIGQTHRVLGAPFASSSASMPPGVMMAFAGSSSSIPAGWLPCDGTSLLRDDYPALYLAIGDAHGGNGSTRFNVPDFRGRFLRGVSDGTGRDPNAANRAAANAGGNTGNAVGSVQGHSFQSHNHANSLSIAERYLAGAEIHPNGNLEFRTGEGGFSDVYNGAPSLSGSISINNGAPSTGQVTAETRPTNVNVNWIIKY